MESRPDVINGASFGTEVPRNSETNVLTSFFFSNCEGYTDVIFALLFDSDRLIFYSENSIRRRLPSYRRRKASTLHNIFWIIRLLSCQLNALLKKLKSYDIPSTKEDNPQLVIYFLQRSGSLVSVSTHVGSCTNEVNTMCSRFTVFLLGRELLIMDIAI